MKPLILLILLAGCAAAPERSQRNVVDYNGTDIWGDPISKENFVKQYGGGLNVVKPTN